MFLDCHPAGCRDAGRERFLWATGWARARKRRRRAGVKGGDEKATAQCDSLIVSHNHILRVGGARGYETQMHTVVNHGFDGRGVNLSSAKSDQGPLLFCRMTEVQFLVAGSKT